MKFTLDLLQEFLKTEESEPLDLDTITDALTSIGYEVESVDKSRENLKNLKIAKIIKAEPHPDADKLQILTIFDGKENLQIVCGASNAREGLISVLAPIGTYLPAIDLTIKKNKIRGIESFGMMCSADELGISPEYFNISKDGIIELSQDAPIGGSVVEYCDIDISPIIDISITPNLADFAYVRGIARELSHYYGVKLIDHPYRDKVLSKYRYSLGLDYFSFSKILHTPTSVLINEDKIQGYCKNQRFSETKYNKIFIGEDGKTYTLNDKDWVITDDEKIIGLTGLMASAETKINNEQDYTNAQDFRDINDEAIVEKIIDTAESFGIENANVKALKSMLAHTKSYNGELNHFKKKLTEYIGQNIDDNFIEKRLNDIGYNINGNTFSYRLSNRYIKDDVDLIHDIMRFYGIDKIKSEPLPLAENLNQPIKGKESDYHKIFDNSIEHSLKAKNILGSNGFIELMTWSFISENLANNFAIKDFELVAVQNPISENKSHMRPSLLPGLLDALSTNLAYNQKNLKFCEISNIYLNKEEDGQILYAAGVRQGTINERNWQHKAKAVDVFNAKQDAMCLLESFNINLNQIAITTETPDYYHPTRSGAIVYANEILGYFGEFHPETLEYFSIANHNAICGFELNLNKIIKYANNKIKPFKSSNLQPISRDVAFIVDINQPALDLQKIVYKQSKFINKVNIFDVYINENEMPGKKSIGLEFSLIPEKTLTSEEINNLMNKIVKVIEQNFNATLCSA